MKDIYAIVATDIKNGFSKNNKIPWTIPRDMQVFKAITTRVPEGYKNAVIMGRKTYEYMGKLLPGRINIILTSQENYSLPTDITKNREYYISTSLEKALDILHTLEKINDIYIIGGKDIYELSIRELDVCWIYKTVIHHDFECDRFFPSIADTYRLKASSAPEESNGYTYHFEIWEKQRPIRSTS
jgi:dihydrofolate reductase